jgi:hypothetical protein
MSFASVISAGSKKEDKTVRPSAWISLDDFFWMYLQSIRQTNPGYPIEVVVINPSDGYVRKILATHSQASVSEIRCNFNTKAEEWLEIRKQEFSLWKRLLAEKKVVLVSDIDVLVRGSISALEDFAKNHDVGFLRSVNCPRHEHFNKGFFTLNGERALKFVQEWESLVFSGKRFEGDREDGWFIMQLAANEAFNNLSGSVNFGSMPKSFHDGDLNSGSLIWHAHKGSKSKRLLEFKKDFTKVLL